MCDNIWVPNKTEDLNLSIFKLITGINQKTLTEHISQNVNVNLMLESAIQIKIGITINVDVSVKFLKNIMYAKKIIFVILKKMANILQVLFKLLLVESLVFVQRAYL